MFRRLVDAVGEYAIFLIDPKGNVSSWNPGAARLKGWSAAEIVGRNIRTFYQPEDVRAKKPTRLLAIARREGQAIDEGWRVRKDGSRFWARVTISRIEDEKHRLLGFSKVTQDRTETRAAERRYRLLVESIRDYAIFPLDPAGRVAGWNSGAERIKGYRAEEIIGKHFSVFYGETDLRNGKPEMELAAAARQGRFEDEGWRIRKDGTRFWANVLLTPLVEEGVLIGYAKITRDLTDRKQLEDMLQRRAAELEAMNRLKDEFLANLSHELRTPLHSMLGWLKLLRGDALEAPAKKKALEAVERNAAMQARLVEDLLDISRVASGKLRLDVSPRRISSIIQSAVDVMRSAVDAKRIRLDVTMPETDTIVSADADRLTQVLWNLLANAVKFTPMNGTIQIQTRNVEEEWVEISVRDSGRGISADFLPYVFERFRQADGSTTRVAGGLGVGLSIARHIVELHGGTIHAQSAGEGHGATFVVRVPITATAPGPVSRVHTQRKAGSIGGLRVLAVDDEPDALALVATTVRAAGANVVTAPSAAHAIRALEEVVPDVILCDIAMPQMNGYDFLRYVRTLPQERTARIPAIALSAFARLEDRRAALDAGFQVHLPKPFDPQELNQVIAQLVGRTVESHPSS